MLGYYEVGVNIMDNVICVNKSEDIKESEICSKYGNLYIKKMKIMQFMARQSEAVVIRYEDLWKYDVAYFDCNITCECFRTASAEMILVDYQIDEDGNIIADKLYKYRGRYSIVHKKFFHDMYGITWRCWTAFPTEEQIQETKWNE